VKTVRLLVQMWTSVGSACERSSFYKHLSTDFCNSYLSASLSASGVWAPRNLLTTEARAKY
jgi:hypothetical protein